MRKIHPNLREGVRILILVAYPLLSLKGTAIVPILWVLALDVVYVAYAFATFQTHIYRRAGSHLDIAAEAFFFLMWFAYMLGVAALRLIVYVGN